MTAHSTEVETAARLEAASSWCLKIADGPLPPRERRAFEAWIAADPENQRAFEDAVGVWRAVKDTGATSDLLAMRREALASFENASRARWTQRRPLTVLMSLAAGAVLSVCGVLLARHLLDSRTYTTAIGERRLLVLADGSKLSMDAQTEVGVRYTGGTRQVRLVHGRAKFDVARDSSRPFTVQAADKIVRATGTAFSVELLQGDVRVILYEGHVEVLNTPNSRVAVPLSLGRPNAPTRTAVEADQALTPGHELDVPIAQSVAQVEAVDPVRSLAWEGGQLVFINEPLSVAIERVNRYSQRKLIVGDVEAGRVNIDGVFTVGDTDAFLEGITAVYHLSIRETSGGVVLTGRH